MQNATILHINSRNGMFVIKFDDGAHSVLELCDSIELRVGDRISGNLDAVASEEFLHLDHRESFSVYGQSGPSGLEACQRLIATQ